MIVHITLEGCDDSTEFDFECNKKEFLFLAKVAEKANENSGYNCQPKMYLNIKNEN